MKILKTIQINNYIRHIKTIKEQKPSYYHYFKKEHIIKAKNKKLLKKYINEKYYNSISNNKVLPKHLKRNYVIAGFQADKIIGYYANIFWRSLNYKLEVNEYEVNRTSYYKQIISLSNTFTKINTYLTNKQKEKPIKYILINYKTKEKIIANRVQIDKPKLEIIDYNKLYNNKYDVYTKNKILKTIKHQINLYIDNSPINSEYFPIGILVELNDTIKDKLDRTKTVNGKDWDLDKRLYPYIKSFYDVLIENKIIPDTNRLVIGSKIIKFIPIKENDISILKFKIFTFKNIEQ